MTATARAPDGRPAVRLLHHMARTGGTVIARCLGCMEGVVLLSEINPRGGQYFNPLAQAHEWFGLLTPEDMRGIERRGGAVPFDEAIALIEQRCRERGRRLVIRDWSHLDFTGVPFVQTLSFELTLARALASRFAVSSIATVRHPVDQWLSLQQLALVRGRIGLEAFLQGCCRFARHAVRIGFLRYEDFTRDPAAAMRQICTALQLPFDAGFIDKWQGYPYISGDVGGAPRSAIAPPAPRALDRELLDRFAAIPAYRETLDLLGYRHRGADPG
jgi:hypothetical protein